MNNPETQATLDTRQCFTNEALEKTKGTVKHEQSRDTDNIGHKTMSLDYSCLTVPLVFSKSSFVKHCLVPNVACVSGLFMLDCPFGFL
jgi:hypothetical protein